MLLWLLLLLPLHGAWRLVARPSPWPRRFLAGIGWIAGARVRVEGAPPPGPALLLANHISWLDIMVLAGASGCRFVSKAEVGAWPLLGWLAGLNKTLYVTRSDRAGVKRQAEALRAAIAGPQSVALFAEGTTGDGTGLLPFNASLLGVAAPAPPEVVVQPVAIDYGAAAPDIAWHGEEGPSADSLSVLRRPGSFAVTVRFLAPLPPTGDRKALAVAAHSAIARALGFRLPGAAAIAPPT